jgi:hypothetical protein
MRLLIIVLTMTAASGIKEPYIRDLPFHAAFERRTYHAVRMAPAVFYPTP